MATITRSITNATTQVVDTVGLTATAASQLVRQGLKAVDALDQTTDVWHARVTARCLYATANLDSEELKRATMLQLSLDAQLAAEMSAKGITEKMFNAKLESLKKKVTLLKDERQKAIVHTE